MTTKLAGNLIIEEGKLLLLYRRDKDHWESQRSQGESCSTNNPEGWWEVPGGKVEENESPTEAAVREAQEEIGVEAELQRPFYTGEFQHDGKIFTWYGYISSIKDRPEIQDSDSENESDCSNGSIEPCEEKFEKMKWFSKEDLEKCDELAPNIRMIKSGLLRLLK